MRRFIDSDTEGDLEFVCQKCGTSFWWTVQEQQDCSERGLRAPKRCEKCRAPRRSPRRKSTALVRNDAQPTALMPIVPELPATVLPELPIEFTDRSALFNDIQQLLWEAATPVEYRERTFLEWWRGVDIRAQQIARKMEASRTADELIQQRTTLFGHLQEMITAATDTQLARLRVQVALQQELLKAIELQEEVSRRRATAAERFATEQLNEKVKQKRLSQAFDERPRERPDPAEETVRQHRKSLRLHAQASQAVISDFLSAVEEICENGYALHEKALRIRKILDVFQMSEDELPRRARDILQADEVVR